MVKEDPIEKKKKKNSGKETNSEKCVTVDSLVDCTQWVVYNPADNN